jgi:hypothetical protein
VSAWEAIFMLVVLKIPLVYLGVVVWWAVRAEPNATVGGEDEAGVLAPLTPCGWDDWKRSRPHPPRRGPVRSQAMRVARAARAHAR